MWSALGHASLASAHRLILPLLALLLLWEVTLRSEERLDSVQDWLQRKPDTQCTKEGQPAVSALPPLWEDLADADPSSRVL